MKRMRQWYERALRRRATRELDEERAKFWTKIDDDINEAKI